ncbi:MAG: hypothetical protein M3Y08_10080 [Fibrobacterota bacterium]|nr:hypothetical protein [Fibrobacterota bacterium]
MARKPDPFPFWTLLGLGAYAVFYFSLIYRPGLVRMDDFGYLQGVIETLQEGRLRTHAWLEPYTATLSGLCALAYLITGNFPLSTWGLQSLFVLAAFYLLFRLFRMRLEQKASVCMALLVATQPVYLHKCSEFAGNIFTLVFVLLAIMAYLRGNWFGFFLAAFLAFANRQNSLALLALPAFHFLWGGAPRSPDGYATAIPGNRRVLLAACFAGFFVAALVLHFHLNRTVAQSHGIYSGFDLAKGLAILRTHVIGAFAGLAFLSGFSLFTGDSALGNFRANLRRPILPAVLTVLFLLIPLIGSVQLLSFLTPLVGSLDRTFWVQRILIVLILALIWLLDFRQLRFDAPACLFLAYTALSGLKGFWYDFYLLDVAFAAVFYRLTREKPLTMRRTAMAASVLLITAHLTWAYGYKILGDKQMLSVAAFERLERAGKIRVEDMSGATFGYAGWKLFDHYVQWERDANMVGYLCYLNLKRVELETELPWRRGYKAGGATGTVLEEGRARIGFFSLRYRVMDRTGNDRVSYCPAAPLDLDSSAYRVKPFPLDTREWSEYIDSRPKTGPAPLDAPTGSQSPP